jgi:iron complex outermembrane receptor protein
VGSKFEHNDYTGFEVQPTGRLLWTPHEKHSIWAAVSRAVRTPSRFEHTISAAFVPIPAPFSYSEIIGNPNYSSEELVAYELGYRVQPLRRVSFDVATFYNVYNRLRAFRATSFSTPPPITYFQPDNSLDGETYGAEIAANWEVTSDWRLSASYTLLQMQLHEDNSIGTFQPEVAEGDSPQNQFQVRSSLNLPFHLEFDTALYYVDNLPARNVQSYFHLDARLGWRPTPEFELSVGVQNLLDNQHPEFGPGFLVNPTEFERSVYAKATLRF